MAQQSIVGGLFGPTPAQIRARMRELQQEQVAQGQDWWERMGIQAGQGLGQALGGLLGADMTPPELREAQQQGQMAQQAFQESGGDTRTGMLNVAQYYFSQGDYDKGAQAIKAAEALTPQGTGASSLIGKVNPQDFTPESLAAFTQTGNYSDLVLRDKPAAPEQTTNQIRNMEHFDSLVNTGRIDDAARFGTMVGLIPEMSVTMQKEYIASSKKAQESAANTQRFGSLASQIETTPNFGAGIGANWTEGLKQFTGQTDAVSALRTEYIGIRNSAAMSNLPPGAASDKDVALALSGFPQDNANASTVASFLRGMAKLEAEVAQYEQAKVEYMADPTNSGLIGFDSAYKKAQEQRSTQPQSEAINWSDL